VASYRRLVLGQSLQVAADGFERNLIAIRQFIYFNLAAKHRYDPLRGKSMVPVRTDRGGGYSSWYVRRF
jgi:hypothetical protein